MDKNGIVQITSAWERVVNVQQPCTEVHEDTDVADMRNFMQAEAISAYGYDALSRRCTRRERAQFFAGLAADENEHLHKLRAAYYLRTGESFEFCPVKTDERPSLKVVREKYIGETEAEKAYLEAAARTNDAALREIYETNAAEEHRHAEGLRRIVFEMLR